MVLEDASKQAGVKITSALPEIVVKGREALNLQQFFTAGPGEVRAWTTRKNMLAPQAAGVIHTDFERGFIMAEVTKPSQLMEKVNKKMLLGFDPVLAKTDYFTNFLLSCLYHKRS